MIHNSSGEYPLQLPSPAKPQVDPAPIPWTHHISGSISSPFRGAFHRSLAVLFAIDLRTCLALDGGPPGFGPDFTCPTLLRNPLTCLALSATGLSPTMAALSRVVRLTKDNRRMRSYNPHLRSLLAPLVRSFGGRAPLSSTIVRTKGPAHRSFLRTIVSKKRRWVWAVPLSLATTRGISNLISFPLLLRCFSSQSVLYCTQVQNTRAFPLVGFPIRKSPVITPA